MFTRNARFMCEQVILPGSLLPGPPLQPILAGPPAASGEALMDATSKARASEDCARAAQAVKTNRSNEAVRRMMDRLFHKIGSIRFLTRRTL
ncbi:MAG TPA: hypothetical protein VG273_01945, partial [Bryobacteraceae bacterium]|nr:hypothetical protein [Bryobacteraceae bacterium]